MEKLTKTVACGYLSQSNTRLCTQVAHQTLPKHLRVSCV